MRSHFDWTFSLVWEREGEREGERVRKGEGRGRGRERRKGREREREGEGVGGEGGEGKEEARDSSTTYAKQLDSSSHTSLFLGGRRHQLLLGQTYCHVMCM